VNKEFDLWQAALRMHGLGMDTDDSGKKRSGKVLRIRTLGQSELCRVVPNGHLASILLKRAHEVTASDTLISMDGARILSLMEMAKRFRKEQSQIVQLRAEGKRTAFVETMYVLDLALDQRAAQLLAKPVPWGRYEEVLRQQNLDAT